MSTEPKNDTKHGAMPYRADENFISDSVYLHVADCRTEDIAAFIVRACNEHDGLVGQRDALLAACKEAKLLLELCLRDSRVQKIESAKSAAIRRHLVQIEAAIAQAQPK
ncbi:MAG: hypothetical protein O7D91_17550 [Planctomycetota bacterium]|nr:hypothetical protein [Planctomycetota bacterium]